jgi:hypothetical protein
MGLNLTNFAPILKTIYTKQKIQNATYKDNPLFAMLPKQEDFYGDSKKIPLIYGNPQGRSATFSTAQGNKGNTASVAFALTRKKDYQLLSIDGETMLASENDAGAFMSARKTEIDGGLRNLKDTMGIDVFGSGSGSRGQMSASQNVALTVVTLSQKYDIVKFEVGMELAASATDGTGSVKTGTMFVKSIDRKAGTFVVSATAGGSAAAISGLISGAAASDYLFAAGDYNSKISGLAAWLVYGGASATSFYGVDRTVDSERLGGVWADLSSLPIEEALNEGAMLLKLNGSQFDKYFMHPTKYKDLVNSLGSKVQYVNEKIADVGFQGIKVQCDDRIVDVYSDRNCPTDRLWGLQMDTWQFASLQQAPMILNMDSLEALREATSDGIEIRMGYYGNMACNWPGANGVFKI